MNQTDILFASRSNDKQHMHPLVLRASFFDLLRGQTVQRRRGHFYKRKIGVDLPTMMNLVLYHGSQPLPHSNGLAIGSVALAVQVFHGEGCDDLSRFAVHPFHESNDLFEAIGKFFAATRISAWLVLNRFCEHPTFDGRYMTQEIAQAELTFAKRPFQLVRRDRMYHAHGSLMDLVEILQKLIFVADFHVFVQIRLWRPIAGFVNSSPALTLF